ncbi:hypothetical protein PRUPE_1G244600 [Prunus persica]|uniref:Uncharacterized protein n=1 Tax=Prunus persica TaxID=3760 RepID=M5XN37_PRUPE|nr:hypothetical protein PRUPE_1G244600 [Prunus persica]
MGFTKKRIIEPSEMLLQLSYELVHFLKVVAEHAHSYSEVLSNGRYKSADRIHRAVTNIVEARLSLAMFYGPNKNTVIGPIEDLIDEEHPPLYRSYKYAEFFEEFFKQEGKRRLVKEAFELHN